MVFYYILPPYQYKLLSALTKLILAAATTSFLRNQNWLDGCKGAAKTDAADSKRADAERDDLRNFRNCGTMQTLLVHGLRSAVSARGREQAG